MRCVANGKEASVLWHATQWKCILAMRGEARSHAITVLRATKQRTLARNQGGLRGPLPRPYPRTQMDKLIRQRSVGGTVMRQRHCRDTIQAEVRWGWECAYL